MITLKGYVTDYSKEDLEKFRKNGYFLEIAEGEKIFPFRKELWVGDKESIENYRKRGGTWKFED